MGVELLFEVGVVFFGCYGVCSIRCYDMGFFIVVFGKIEWMSWLCNDFMVFFRISFLVLLCVLIFILLWMLVFLVILFFWFVCICEVSLYCSVEIGDWVLGIFGLLYCGFCLFLLCFVFWRDFYWLWFVSFCFCWLWGLDSEFLFILV